MSAQRQIVRIQSTADSISSELACEHDKSICEVFEQRVLQMPNNTALSWPGGGLTYLELDNLVSTLAQRLKQLHVGPEVIVGTLLERSAEMIIGLLAILKAGGAYLPLDVQLPPRRLEFMLADSGAKIILTQKKVKHLVSSFSGHVVDLEDGELFHQKNGVRLPLSSGPGNLAYVMYTSGSTGTPKAVCVPQGAVVRLVRHTNYAQFGPQETFLQFAPLSFDAATFEIWGALLNGGHLVLYPARPTSAQEFGDWLSRSGVTTLWLTAGFFHQLVQLDKGRYFQGLRQLLAGGDVLSVRSVSDFLRRYPNCKIINGYGPT